MRVPMIASVRSSHAPRAGSGAAGAAVTACMARHGTAESAARMNLSMRVIMALGALGYSRPLAGTRPVAAVPPLRGITVSFPPA